MLVDPDMCPPRVPVLVFLSVYNYRCYCSDNSIAEIRQAIEQFSDRCPPILLEDIPIRYLRHSIFCRTSSTCHCLCASVEQWSNYSCTGYLHHAFNFRAILFMFSRIMRILKSLTEVNEETGFTMIGQGDCVIKRAPRQMKALRMRYMVIVHKKKTSALGNTSHYAIKECPVQNTYSSNMTRNIKVKL